MINLCIRICYNGISPGFNCLSNKNKKTKSLLFGFVLFLHMEFFFLKLINIEEENKKKKRDCYIVLFDYFPTCIFI